MAAGELEEWSTGCCDCMDDTDTFGFNVADLRDVSYSAPCYMYALACCLGCPCLVAARTRTEIRTKYGLKEGPLPDHLMHFPCCTFLALCQETRQLRKMMQPSWPAPTPNAPNVQPTATRGVTSRGSVSSRGASEPNTGSAPNTGPLPNAVTAPGGGSVPGSRTAGGSGNLKPPSGLSAGTKAGPSSAKGTATGGASSSKLGSAGSVPHASSKPPSGPKSSKTSSAANVTGNPPATQPAQVATAPADIAATTSTAGASTSASVELQPQAAAGVGGGASTSSSQPQAGPSQPVVVPQQAAGVAVAAGGQR